MVAYILNVTTIIKDISTRRAVCLKKHILLIIYELTTVVLIGEIILLSGVFNF